MVTATQRKLSPFFKPFLSVRTMNTRKLQVGTSVLDYAVTYASFALDSRHHLLSSCVEYGLQNLKLMRSLVTKSDKYI